MTTTKTAIRQADKPALAYARMRRWLGIAYVGTIVTLSAFALYSGAPVKIFAHADSSPTAWFLDLAECLVAFSLLCLPFDLLGYRIERLYKRTSLSLPAYLRRWSTCSLKHTFALAAVAATITACYRVGGTVTVVAAFLGGAVLLTARQDLLAHYYSGMKFTEAPQAIKAAFPQNRNGGVPLLVAQSDEICFSGGIIGLPRAEKIVLPQRWLQNFSQEEMWTEVTRRNLIIASGGRSRGLALAITFNAIGVIICTLIPAQVFFLRLDTASGLLTMSLCFTLWSFLGLLLMPYPSQLGAMEADRLALQKGVNRELLLQTIGKIDSYLEDEKTRSRAVDSIFHPIPTVEYRARAIDDPHTNVSGAWHAARYSILFSMLGLSLLGRAVHCNAGKPDLWAMLPAD
ncbi:MAG: hypothetical protein KGS72_20470 [Cyanobacteria bacterium REEB67]|nr:hypothetical protein [Cyanobacteria bacterium REEB67]